MPGLATVLVGDNPASHVYVRSKHKACQEAGIVSFGYELPENASLAEVVDLVKKLNDDPAVHGILVQLPLPSGLDEEKVLSTVRIEKDVDGFHPVNIGRLAQKGRDPLFVPCTPSGVMYLLEKYATQPGGDERGGAGALEYRGHAGGTASGAGECHHHHLPFSTKNLKEITRSADILVAAVGQPEMVRGDWVKPGAVVIDVGINRVEDASRPRGYRLGGGCGL